MLTVEVADRAQFEQSITKWISAVKAGTVKAVTKIARAAQIEATRISPVYSGDFASNWNVSYGAPDTSFEGTNDYYGLGYPDPVESAWGVGKFNLSGLQFGQTVYLTNAAEHDEPYAWKIENNKIKFRAVNRGKHAVRAKTLASLSRTFRTVPKGMLV